MGGVGMGGYGWGRVGVGEAGPIGPGCGVCFGAEGISVGCDRC